MIDAAREQVAAAADDYLELLVRVVLVPESCRMRAQFAQLV